MASSEPIVFIIDGLNVVGGLEFYDARASLVDGFLKFTGYATLVIPNSFGPDDELYNLQCFVNTSSKLNVRVVTLTSSTVGTHRESFRATDLRSFEHTRKLRKTSFDLVVVSCDRFSTHRVPMGT